MRERMGLTQAAAARALGIHVTILNAFEALRESPLSSTGEGWKNSALYIANAYHVPPEYLWPVEARKICQICASFEAAFEQLRRMNISSSPEDRFFVKETVELLYIAMKELTPREAQVVAWRYGLGDADELTLEEIGHELGVGRSRVYQIYMHAINKLYNAMFRLDPTAVHEWLDGRGVRRRHW